MPPFEIHYRPESRKLGDRAIRVMRVSTAVLLVVVAAEFVLVALAASNSGAHGGTAVLTMGLAAVSGVALALLAVALKATFSVRRRLPPVAARFDQYGVWQWPLKSGDYVVPWSAIHGITANATGLSLLTVSLDPDLPGSVGLTSPTTRRVLRQQSRVRGSGIPWRYVEPVDPAGFEAAVLALSQGRCRVERG